MNKNKKELASKHLKWRKTQKNRPVPLSQNHRSLALQPQPEIYVNYRTHHDNFCKCGGLCTVCGEFSILQVALFNKL